MSNYHFLILFIIVITSYLFSLFLVKLQKITLNSHRRFWNIILLTSFLVSGIIGLVLAFFIDQKISIIWYLPFLWLHVEFGIVMALVSIFHLFWHLPYFKIMVKSR